jgi:methionyl-tRNA formyltransferase
MRLLLLGSGAFGLPTFRALAAHHDIAAIVTQPDKPAGRGSQPTPTPVGEWAQTLPCPLFKPPNINTPEMIDQLRALSADAWVVIAFGQKLSKKLLDGIFAINLHASILPRWRGAAPINAAILNGDPITGNSVITLADKMDAGLVLATSSTPINPSTTAGQLHDLLANDGPPLVQSVLSQHATNSLNPITQTESLVTIAPKLSKSDGLLNFSLSAELCRRRVHAFNPWPGVAISLANTDLKLLRVQDEQPETAHPAPGTLIDPHQGLVACATGILRLLEVQPAGKKPMDWTSFARGRTLSQGLPLSPPSYATR